MPARAPRPPMGIATKISHTNKCIYVAYLKTFSSSNFSISEKAIKSIFTSTAQIDAFHPLNETKGALGYLNDIIKPMQHSFRGFQRQDNIVSGGEYLGEEWVTSTGYYLGHFENPWLGIPPSGKLEHIRFGEFHRMVDGKIVQSQIFMGVAELLIDLDIWPLNLLGGYEGVTPGPASHDGFILTENDSNQSRSTADLVEGMLMELSSTDAAWLPYWDDNMIWYGPGGFGSYVTTEAFAAFQVPFEKTFEGWGDGTRQGITGVGSQCKAGDGNYAFLSGWPQITGIHVKTFMGIEPTHRRIYMRDCDWWRCKDGKIVENWCMVDTLHLVNQLGRDILSEISS
jgi:predicted ester cyclase